MQIGTYVLRSNVLLAPMAGVTDRPFRQLCKQLGAGLGASEMIAATPHLWRSRESRRRVDHTGELAPHAVQIVGASPSSMAELARLSVDEGADIIDINMGCPARRVCRRAAGSALFSDEALVQRILEAVVRAVAVPVTLKMRTGPEPQRRNAVRVASLAEQSGIAAVSLHGRTRKCGYDLPAEYETVRAVKTAVSIPVIANGDIDSPQKARSVLATTRADAVMIGRAAWGNPWIFRNVNHFLRTGAHGQLPTLGAISDTVLGHLDQVYQLYGERTGVRIARKHLSWYCRGQSGGERFWRDVSRAETSEQQLTLTRAYYAGLQASVA